MLPHRSPPARLQSAPGCPAEGESAGHAAGPSEVVYHPSMTVILWHYPNCSTCKKALRWLKEREIDCEAIDLVATPPRAGQLEDMHRRSGLATRRLFNTSGLSYRGGGWKDRLPGLADAEAYEALAADGKLIKRPLLDTGSPGTVLVGFREAEYEAALG